MLHALLLFAILMLVGWWVDLEVWEPRARKERHLRELEERVRRLEEERHRARR